jgi:hypothetical protein
LIFRRVFRTSSPTARLLYTAMNSPRAGLLFEPPEPLQCYHFSDVLIGLNEIISLPAFYYFLSSLHTLQSHRPFDPMENLSSSTRASKRRKLASPSDGQAESLAPEDSSLGWGLTGLVERMFRNNSKNPPTQKSTGNGNAPSANALAKLVDSKNASPVADAELENGHNASIGDEAELSDNMKETQEANTPNKRRRRGRPSGRRNGSSKPGQHDGYSTPMINGASGGRVLRGNHKANSATNGIKTPSKERTTPIRRRRMISAEENATSPRRGESESPDPLSQPDLTTDRVLREENNATGDATNTEDYNQSELPETMDVDKPEETPLQPRSSGRERKRPRRYSLEIEMAETTKQKRSTGEIVGILTPSKRRKGGVNRRKKSVVFERPSAEDDLENLGFSDIQRSNGLDAPGSAGLINGNQPHLPGGIDPSDDGLASLEDIGLDIRTQEILVPFLSDANAHMDELKELDELPDFARDFQTSCQFHGLEEVLPALSKGVLEQLTSKRRIPLVGLEDEYSKVHQVVKQTIVAGEGNSLLILGARGTGKTALVETAISDLAKDHQDDFHVVRLNGFVHTDDRLALKEIWRQLGREMETEDEIEGNPISYADTLSSLLALLSHPEELSGEETESAAKSVIFIMDEFDLFASHPRQTLLYNLFDIAQARKAPIAVLGLSTKIDVAEDLEKRVKSRFSHRYVHLPMPKNFKTFEAICKAGLEIGYLDESDFDRKKIRILVDGWSKYLKVSVHVLAAH